MADSKASALTALTTLTGDETLYIVEDDDGTPVSRRMTIEDFLTAIAARTELTGTYAPLVTSIFIPAQAFVNVNGSPVFGEAGTDVPAYLLDQASTERVATVAGLPQAWATFDVIIVWSNAAGGSGDVAWQISYSSGFGDGESAVVATNSSIVAATAPVTGTAEFTTIATGLSAPSAGELLPVRVSRIASDAGDTLGNDAGFIGLRLVKAS